MKNLIYFFIISIISIYFGFFAFDKDTMLSLYYNLSYYILSFAIFIWLYYLYFILNKDTIHNFLYNHKIAILLTIVIVGLFIFICPPEFKILADETNLLGTSKSLYEEHKPFVSASEFKIFNNKKSLAYSIDKRMLFFPYCVSILHSIIGYSYNNAFIVNILACFGCLICFYYIIQLFFGKFYGIIAILSFSAYPLFIQYSMSAGYDVFSMFWALLNFIIFYKFLTTKTKEYSEFLLYSTLLLAYTRYETTLMAIIVLPFVYFNINKNEFEKQSFGLTIYPFLFLPIPWIMSFANTHEYLQVEDVSKSLFSFDYFFPNFFKACKILIDFNTDFGFIPLFSIIFIISFFIITTTLIVKKETRQITKMNWIFILYCLAFLLIQCIVKFSYINGDLTNPLQTRMATIFIPYILFFVISFYYRLIAINKETQFILLVITCFLSIYGWSEAHKNWSAYKASGYNTLKVMREFFERYPNKQDYLIVSPKATYLIPFGYNVVMPEIFNINYENIKKDLNNKIWTDIFFIQEYYDGYLQSYSEIIYKGNTLPLYEKITEDHMYFKFSKFNFEQSVKKD